MASFREIFCMEDQALTPWFKEIRNRGLLSVIWSSRAFKPDSGERIIDFYNYDKQMMEVIKNSPDLAQMHKNNPDFHTTDYFVRYTNQPISQE